MILHTSTKLRQAAGLAPARGKTTVPHLLWEDMIKQHGQPMAQRVFRAWMSEARKLGHTVGEYIPKDDRHGAGIVYWKYKQLVLADRVNRRKQGKKTDLDA